VAFAGRSNAGKSSALNAITGRKELARTSKTPGRTQLINFFALEGEYRLADLPGYGYAKVPERMKRHWQALMSAYVAQRESLAGIVIVMDARRPLTDVDVQMLDWAHAHGLPVHVLLTKADKLSRNQAVAAQRRVLDELPDSDSVQLFSAVTKLGVDEARKRVLEMLRGPGRRLCAR